MASLTATREHAPASVRPQPRRVSSRAAPVPTLQRQLGNRAFRQAAPGARPHVQRCACGGSCPHCKAKEEAAIQTRLTVGAPGDAYEREAEAVAERVTRMPDGAAQGVGGAASGIQRLAGGGASAGTTDLALPSAGARSLSPQTRAFMEPRFGADFSGVRVHEGREAQSAAQKLEARAFTSGRDIWLGRGAQEGDRRLMAHELTHVVQQSGGGAAGRIQRDPPRPPPPPAPAPAAPQPCPNGVRTVSIDLVSLHGSTRNALDDLDFANQNFAQCCVRFELGQGTSVDEATTRTWLGGDTDLQRVHSCSDVGAEEEALRVGATGALALSSRYRVFYMASMTPSLRGVNFSPDCSSGARAPFNRHLYISNAANRRTLSHELGHIPIVGLDDHNTHGGTANNLMIPNGPGTELTPAQCTDVFNNI